VAGGGGGDLIEAHALAQELRMPLGTVKSHVSRGLIKLRKLLATRTTIEVGDDE
jgi:DNA-directed RNA polymerase specialized sigma24 family protein